MDASSLHAASSSSTSLVPQPPRVIPYSPHDWSSYSGTYHPSNILVDNPTDQASRWSSGTNDLSQFLTLKLESDAVAELITFGKYYKVHVCNLKEFKIYAGMTQNQMIEVLHAGLRNDEIPETFPLKHIVRGVLYPCRFIRIVPLASWGQNFNFSVWYVQVLGTFDPSFIQTATQHHKMYREHEAVRLCLSYLRQQNLAESFQVLQAQTGVQLEDPMLTALHASLVVQGNFDAVEQMLNEACRRGVFHTYVSEGSYHPIWRRIYPKEGEPAPSKRGGHQMSLDVNRGIIYLFGGWDGYNELADFWSFDIKAEEWHCISKDTQADGGPCARSCHKMCYDPIHRRLYSLGRYVDHERRSETALHNDFHVYLIDEGRWELLSRDTSLEGGPELLYDHQVCLDTERQCVYVFGGRVITLAVTESVYSGLYSYHIPTKKWTLLRNDANRKANVVQLRSRTGHSMLLHEERLKLFIFAGQRGKDSLSDFYAYDIPSDRVTSLSWDSTRQGGPSAGFTPRATIDPSLNELYVLGGLSRDKTAHTESLWVFNLDREKWTCIRQENMGYDPPCPRYGHQLVYDNQQRIHYLFGGNPGENGQSKERLDDFWELRLRRPDSQEVLRRATLMVRRQRFLEMCRSHQPTEALKFLQEELAEVVDHTKHEEEEEFRGLPTALFSQSRFSNDTPDQWVPTPVTEERIVFRQRTKLFRDLLALFPKDMREPEKSVLDLT